MRQILHYAQEAQRVEHGPGIQLIGFFFVFFFFPFFPCSRYLWLVLDKGPARHSHPQFFSQVSPLLTYPLRNFSVICCGLGKAALSPPRGSVGDYNS